MDCIRPSRAPNMKYKYLLGNGAQSLGRVVEDYRRVAKATDTTLVRAVAQKREFICEAIRVSSAPYKPSGKGLAAPVIRPGGSVNASVVLRSLSRVAQDAFCGYSVCILVT